MKNERPRESWRYSVESAIAARDSTLKSASELRDDGREDVAIELVKRAGPDALRPRQHGARRGSGGHELRLDLFDGEETAIEL